MHAANPFSRPHDRKFIFNSRASILTLRQCHSFPYKGFLYISSLNLARKTNTIFFSIK